MFTHKINTMSDVMDINKENIVNGAASVKGKKTVSKRKEAQFQCIHLNY